VPVGPTWFWLFTDASTLRARVASSESVAAESSWGSEGRSTRAAAVGTQFCSAAEAGSGKNDSPKRTVWAWPARNGSSARFSSLQRVGQTVMLQELTFALVP